jgi:hypothetical protein
VQTDIATRKIGSRRAVTLEVQGEVSPSDALEVVRDVGTKVDSTIDLIYVRVGKVRLTQLGRPELRNVAETWTRGPIPDDMPIVVAVADALAYGVVRIVLAFGRNDNARAFRDESSAEAWIEALPRRSGEPDTGQP